MSILHAAGIALVLLTAPAAADGERQTAVVAVQAGSAAVPPPEPDLAALRWVARPLVVFADTQSDARFVRQMEMLEREADVLEERGVVVLTDTDPAANGPLRLALRPQDFTLVLIDRDGSIVQRRPSPTPVRELSRTIDRLPSRRQETNSMRQ